MSDSTLLDSAASPVALAPCSDPCHAIDPEPAVVEVGAPVAKRRPQLPPQAAAVLQHVRDWHAGQLESAGVKLAAAQAAADRLGEITNVLRYMDGEHGEALWWSDLVRACRGNRDLVGELLDFWPE
jgi:hypothetical protein